MNTIADYFRLLSLNETLGAGADPVDLLNKLSEQADVCDIKTSELGKSQKLFMYATNDNGADERAVLFLMLDNELPYNTDELADEGYVDCDDDEPLYFTESSNRVSPVFQMKKLVAKYASQFDKAYYVLLTSVAIINKGDMMQGAVFGHDHIGWDGDTTLVCDSYSIGDKEIEANKSTWLNEEERSEGEEDNGSNFDHLLKLFDKYSNRGKKENEVEDEAEDEAEDDSENEDDSKDEDEDWDSADLFDFEYDDELEEKSDPAPKVAPNPKVFAPVKGKWQDYVADDDPDFFEEVPGTYQKKTLQVAPCTIYEPVDNADTLLDNLVGMSQMKDKITNLIALNRYNDMLRECGRQTHNITLHSVFTGNPGTGKTTLASILGSLLKSAGILSKGHVVVCNRASFCSGTHWGDEERSVNQLVKIAQGGVLFIDEAYNLVSENPHDPGYQVLPNLLDMLADEQKRDICVVLAGYPKEMQQLMATNPGLESRFPNHFEFSDYTIDELMKITKNKMGVFGYEFTPAAKQAYLEQLKRLYNESDKKTWGNARAVSMLLEQTYLQHALRVVKSHEANFMKLKVADIPAAAKVSTSLPKPKRIGF